MTMPNRPTKPVLPTDDPARVELVQRVSDALGALPIYFATTTFIEGLDAGDLFSLNTLFGGAIEIQVVATLNRLRDVWDPDKTWEEYHFERSPQSFPDVRLVTKSAGKPSPVIGIELKGWYLLAKEEEPSFRYKAAAAASSPYDLIAVVPWRLSNVLAGTPVVYSPYIESSAFAAKLRNHYWQYEMQRKKADTDTRIDVATNVTAYPLPKVSITDKPKSDNGNNFGRIARVKGLMSDFREAMMQEPVAGIPAKAWIDFFSAYTREDNAEKDVRRFEQQLRDLIKRSDAALTAEIRGVLDRLGSLPDKD